MPNAGRIPSVRPATATTLTLALEMDIVLIKERNRMGFCHPVMVRFSLNWVPCNQVIGYIVRLFEIQNYHHIPADPLCGESTSPIFPLTEILLSTIKLLKSQNMYLFSLSQTTLEFPSPQNINIITPTLNERHRVPDHWSLDNVCSKMCWANIQKASNSRITGLFEGNPPVTGGCGSPNKGH